MARSGVRPKPITSRTTSGALYVRRSENSSARTWVITADDSDDTISGKRSVMPPGWMPDPCSVALSARQGLRWPAPLVLPVGIDPADRGDDVLARPEDPRMTTCSSGSSGEYMTQSASASAQCVDAGAVAATPIGSSPASSAASRPSLSALCTQHPTSSSSGWRRMPWTRRGRRRRSPTE